MDNNEECNGLEIGGWEFHVFVCDNGTLGFTVYERGKKSSCEDAGSVDIFVETDMNVTHR